MGNNQYSEFLMQNKKRLNIPLENFNFFHSPKPIEEEKNHFYIPDETATHQLKNCLRDSNSQSGS